jgi:hypothetical protein
VNLVDVICVRIGTVVIRLEIIHTMKQSRDVPNAILINNARSVIGNTSNYNAVKKNTAGHVNQNAIIVANH